MERAVAHLLKTHAEQDASEALHPDEDTQRRHEERTIETLRRNADKLRTTLASTTERIGAKGKPIKRNLTDAQSATLKSGRGVLQGYIGVAAVDGERQVIVEAQAHGTPQEHDLLQPVIVAYATICRRSARTAPPTRPPGWPTPATPANVA